MLYNDKVIKVEKNNTISNDNITPGTKYHYEELKDLLEDNIITVENGKIELDFKTSTSIMDYREAVSAYTYIDLWTGCIKKEFSKDINEGKAKLEILLNAPKSEDVIAFVNVKVDGTDVEDFIERMRFLISVFNTVLCSYNETVKLAANGAKILKIAKPNK